MKKCDVPRLCSPQAPTGAVGPPGVDLFAVFFERIAASRGKLELILMSRREKKKLASPFYIFQSDYFPVIVVGISIRVAKDGQVKVKVADGTASSGHFHPARTPLKRGAEEEEGSGCNNNTNMVTVIICLQLQNSCIVMQPLPPVRLHCISQVVRLAYRMMFHRAVGTEVHLMGRLGLSQNCPISCARNDNPAGISASSSGLVSGNT
ncbi:hypothetical protein EYF80_028507 [Liparis tanakae]|uniref:Uncharacterized protein n=1 Tax=Liparis tanakae TaxID=230148 RepID=A0A4Z2H8V4_9TELE|nr:hypothetical protein EYF80_028507 [Liparis tanakae]